MIIASIDIDIEHLRCSRFDAFIIFIFAALMPLFTPLTLLITPMMPLRFRHDY